ncbi:hypothetical protein JMJ35_003001 [Cladonia borealis]|uniref:DM2 domain-containing protein n=1 Tax=Cladonia borealis TaxID=184061 RepID=A0AA39R668_9LECA|nr:hypothetical protein JMJ35_003001 [Cladonia borealis]
MNPAMQRQYATNYQQMPQQKPHHQASVRRPPGPMSTSHASHMQKPVNMVEEQQRENARRAAEQHALAKRRSEKPTDKNMPEGVEDLIVGDGVQQYKRLREVERKLDAVMMRKKLDQLESLHNAVKKYTTIRIWVSNTVENQPWQGAQMDENAFDFNMGVEATYKVKIEGRVIPDDEDEDASEKDSDDEEDGTDENPKAREGGTTSQPPNPSTPRTLPKTKLSHFFKSITIDFDRNKNLQPDGTTQIEWKRPPLPNPNGPGPMVYPAGADFDCLEFERKGDENINCTVNFYRDDNPERMQLSPALAAVLDTEEDDRPSVIMGLWEYIKAMGLSQDDDKRTFQCDDKLRAIFHQETFYFPHIPKAIIDHLTPLPPLSLPYTIRVDPDHHHTTPPIPTIYTLRLPIPPSHAPPPPSLHTLKQLSSYDEHLALLIQALGAAQRKHSFLKGYAKDPVRFLKRWMGSQKRDLEVVLGEGGRMEGEGAGAGAGAGGLGLGGEWRRGGEGGVWGTEQVREGVGLLVQKAGRDGRAF